MNVANSISPPVPKQIAIGDQTFTILFPDLLRPLTEPEYAGLKTDIGKRGVVVAILVDEDLGVIDGIHRLRVAHELGLKTVPFESKRGLSFEQKREWAVALNEHRRQLSPEDRQEQVKRLRQEGMSTRQIGERLGVNHSTVVRDLEGGADAPPETITGRDGKTYPATRPQTSPSAPVPEGTPEASGRDLKAVSELPTPDRITGRDGKSYPATKPPVPGRSEKGMPKKTCLVVAALIKTLNIETLNREQLNLVHRLINDLLGGPFFWRERKLEDKLMEIRRLIKEKLEIESKP
jgi:hypothetical protein